SNLEHLDLSGNNLARLPEGIFDGLSQLKRLNLTRSSLTELPEGAFDDVLDTLGMPYRFGGRDDGGGLLLDADLQATLAFLWPEQMAMAGDDVSVTVSLTRPLPVSLRIPYTLHVADGSGATDTMTELSPSPPDQLLIPAGETLSDITLTLEGNLRPGDTVVLSLGELTEIGLRRSDGEGSDAPYLWTATLLRRPITSGPHLVKLAGAAAQRGCDRTGPVRDRLMEIAGVADCEEVTARHLASVRELDLTLAGIGKLHSRDFSGLVNLEHLNLSGNSLALFPKGIFEGLSRLESLNLSGNPLESLPEELFRGLGSLRVLTISQEVHPNRLLTHLPERLLEGLGSLQILDLSRNALKQLPERIFRGLAKLEYLDLSRNVLVDLPAGIFRGLNQLKHLDLSGNESNRHVLNRLPEGIFDAVLDTLGGPFRLDGEIHQGKLHSSLRSTLDFSASGQTARQGTTVKASVTLSRVLPVAVRVPYAVGGTAAADAYTGLSPSPSDGLLFPAGEVRGEIVLSLSKDTSNEGKTITLTLAKPAEIGLRRSDGTGIDAPYLGLDTFTNTDRIDEEPTHVVTISEAGPGDPDRGRARFVPVILTAAGRNNSFFTSELTLTNRGTEPAFLNYTYTADAGGGSGTATDRLDPGRQTIEIDAIDYLRRLGIPIPATGNRIGTLRVGAPGSSGVGVMARTSTNVPEGRAGLAYPGVPEEEGFDEPVYLCGLRQNSRDRSNVAFQNMGAPGEGTITLRTTVYSGEAADATPRELADVELGPGEFHQYSGLLGRVENGYVKVERVEGEAPFYAYGVINDQANSDGSFIFPVTAASLEGKRRQTLPVIVETGEFSSELTATNFSDEPRTLDFEFVSEQVRTEDKRVGFSMTLQAGEQVIVPELVEALRREGMAGLGATRGVYLGPLFVTAAAGDLGGVVVGARTGSKGGGGQYSVFYSAAPEGEGFAREAWVEGLQQNEENRSNLALVNTGEVDGSESVFHLEIYDGETGMLVETVVTRPIPARSWHQVNGILGRASAETRQGYVRIEKVSGENPFLAYG
ncbi:MAG: leucine-rich repeat protein, partial [Acidobacteriota bacterium]|nr:leucine-rich repeat protein [Acidobacteriota bacterium]